MLKKKAAKKVVNKKKKTRGEVKSGALYAVAAFGTVAFLGTVLAGGITPTITKLDTPPPQKSLYTCCDTGEGADCRLILENQITFKGEAYALLKSHVFQSEGVHIIPTNEYAADGRRIFVNNSQRADYTRYDPSCVKGTDKIRIYDPTNPKRKCYAMKDDLLVYVCGDTPEKCKQQVNPKTVPFDVYYRIKDGEIPAELKSFCPRPKEKASSKGQQVIGVPTPGGRKNLQLEWFQIQQEKAEYTWLGAWCKPAINLYPKEKSKIHVEVAPKGEFTLTIPAYPGNGWNVTADPNGKIYYGGNTYPYLYWEAAMPDGLIKQPNEGFVVKYDKLGTLFNTIMPQLGLNAKEQKEFSEYWLKALPNSPYYFVGVVPQNEVDEMAPLKVQPAPDSVLRVTLYFKALDKEIEVTAPKLDTIERKGFNVTEWGGFFKADKNHKNFTCLM